MYFKPIIPETLSLHYSDVTKIEEGIGDKIGNFFQWFSTFVSGIVIGFTYGWKLCLVILATSPLLVVSGGVFTKVTLKQKDAGRCSWL